MTNILNIQGLYRFLSQRYYLLKKFRVNFLNCWKITKQKKSKCLENYRNILFFILYLFLYHNYSGIKAQEHRRRL